MKSNKLIYAVTILILILSQMQIMNNWLYLFIPTITELNSDLNKKIIIDKYWLLLKLISEKESHENRLVIN